MSKKEKHDAASAFELGAVRTTWEALETCTTRIADLHASLSAALRGKLVDPLAAFVKEKDAPRKDAIHVGVASGKVRADALADALKHATVCDKLAAEMHELDVSPLSNPTGDLVGSKAVTKHTAKRDAARDRLAAARAKLAAAQTKAAQADVQYFSNDLPHALRAIELFESNRVTFLQTLLTEFNAIEDQLATTVSRNTLPEFASVVDTLDAVGYIDTVMRLMSNTPNPNAPIPLQFTVPEGVTTPAPPATSTPASPLAVSTEIAPNATVAASTAAMVAATLDSSAPQAVAATTATAPATPVVASTPSATPDSTDDNATASSAAPASTSTASRYMSIFQMKNWRGRRDEQKTPTIAVTPASPPDSDRVVSSRIVSDGASSTASSAVPVASAPDPSSATSSLSSSTVVPISAPLPPLTPSRSEGDVTKALQSPRGDSAPTSPANPKRPTAAPKKGGGEASSPQPLAASGSLKRGNWKEKMIAAMERGKRSVDGEPSEASAIADAEPIAVSPAAAVSSSPPTPAPITTIAGVQVDELEDIPL
jgi:hypothetical protein